jgi:acetate kinase
MKILVLNSGSSSIKCQYFIDQKSIASAMVERIGEKESYSEVKYNGEKLTYSTSIPDQNHALTMIFTLLKESTALTSMDLLDAIGHRVVHGGNKFDEPKLINKEVIDTIYALIPLAPLHNPANLEAIEVLYNKYPDLPQVAVFDTAFHQSMPQHAYLYPIPYKLSKAAHIRRYGFHGTSHAYVAKEAAKMLNSDLETVNLITLHLGNGASATAVRSGKSIDTSMGMTPLEGLMMGTRSGDIDPAIIPYLVNSNEMTIDEIDRMLNKESGLKGICGTNDMREVIERAAQDDKQSTLAAEMYVYRIKKYIGAYTVALGHVDAIVFTGGIGEHAVKIREMVCEGLYDSIGASIDLTKNQMHSSDKRTISDEKSKIQLFVIPTNEELEIVLQTQELLKNLEM